VLDRDHAAGREALAIANAIDLVHDGNDGVAGEQEIGMERVRRPIGNIDGAAGGDQRLADHLAAINALPAHLRRAAAKEIDFDLLQIEDAQQIRNRRGHRRGSQPRRLYRPRAARTQCYSSAHGGVV